jgi:pyruvate/2-oxoglutarate dehydrogenase complex dihydrolipoamide acyltransferase (E2) component
MKSQHVDYQVVPYPKVRRFLAAELRASHRTPMIRGLIDVDVSTPRTILRDHKARTGESLSFTAFLATCLAKAVDEHKAVQALRHGKRRLIVFNEVDMLTYVERGVAPMPYVIRAANRKTVREIHQEIRTAQVQDVAEAAVGFHLVQYLPTMLFRFLLRMLERDPALMKRYVGTVALTSVGMFGNGAGWGIPPAAPPALWVTVGGIGEKPGVVDRQIAIREYLSLTISVDHEIVDGAPAARFAERLKQLIESGYGLDEFMAASEPAGAVGASKQTVNAAHILAREVAQ